MWIEREGARRLRKVDAVGNLKDGILPWQQSLALTRDEAVV